MMVWYLTGMVSPYESYPRTPTKQHNLGSEMHDNDLMAHEKTHLT